jgi:hypothetical protein
MLLRLRSRPYLLTTSQALEILHLPIQLIELLLTRLDIYQHLFLKVRGLRLGRGWEGLLLDFRKMRLDLRESLLQRNLLALQKILVVRF